MSDPTDMPFFFKMHPGRNLGLFNLVRTPVVNVNLEYGPSHSIAVGFRVHYCASVDIQDTIHDLVVLNPVSLSVLNQIEIQVVLQKPWNDADKGGFRVDAIGITVEQDPSDSNTRNFFPPQFQDPNDYKQPIIYLSHGIADVFQASLRDCMVKNVFLRVRYVFAPSAGITKPPFDIICTYRPTVNWVLTEDPHLEARLPALPRG
jgi:hypothetical protein